jgi:hypothetical protein
MILFNHARLYLRDNEEFLFPDPTSLQRSYSIYGEHILSITNNCLTSDLP